MADQEIVQDNQPKLIDQNAKVGPDMGDDLTVIGRRNKKKPIQITWENITITALPPKGKCKPKNSLKEPKEIIKGVSGTVMPGQFLAIIGASGKSLVEIKLKWNRGMRVVCYVPFADIFDI